MNKIYINDYLEHLETISKLEANANNIATSIKSELKNRIKIILPELNMKLLSSIFIKKDMFWVTFDDNNCAIRINFKHVLLTDNINEVKFKHTENIHDYYFVKDLTNQEWEMLEYFWESN